MKKVKKVLVSIGSFLLDLLLRVAFVFRDLGLGVWKGLVAIKNAFVKFGKRFMDGSVWTKISHFIMGAGNFARKQFVKGTLFLAIEVLFIVFMVTSPQSTGTHLGAKAIEGFFTLGEYHGMPIDSSYDFEKEFIGLVELPATNFASEYKAEVEKTYRLSNVIDALDDKEDGIKKVENSGKNQVKNDKGKVVYNPKDGYGEVIYDNRFETNDRYGYAAYDASEGCEIDVADGTLIWLESEDEIVFDDLKDQIKTGKTSTTYCL